MMASKVEVARRKQEGMGSGGSMESRPMFEENTSLVGTTDPGGLREWRISDNDGEIVEAGSLSFLLLTSNKPPI